MARVSAGYPQYGTYKYSGQEWLGSIPRHWEVKALKHGATIVLGKMLCAENKGGYSLRSYLKSKNIQWLNVEISSVDEMWFSKGEMELYRLKKGDLVLSEGGEVGKTCYWNEELPECYIQNSAHRVRFFEGHNPRYFLYQFFSAGKIGHFESIVSRVSIAHLTREKLANTIFAFPTEQEQAYIAHFLDQQSVKIDAVIQIKERQIELLKERKQILIQQTVTRGLDPNAPMRDSGIEWIGEIPAHWSIKRAKHLFREVDERSPDGQQELLSVSHLTGVTPRSEKNVTMFMSEDYTGSKTCQKDDLVFNIMWAWMGALGVSDRAGIVSSAYGIYRQLQSGTLNSQYLEMLLKTTAYIAHYNKVSTGLHSSRLRFYGHMFMAMGIGFPDREEQDAIVTYLDLESGKLNKAIDLLEQQIAKLKEYKATLINSAVTGKIKVPGVVEPTEIEEREIA